jgi:molybdopterin converting factor small subunit
MAVRLLLFAAAREAAGRRHDTFDVAAAPTIERLLAVAVDRYGAEFAAVCATARIWLNADEPPDGASTLLSDGDEVAVLPPVSGGC